MGAFLGLLCYLGALALLVGGGLGALALLAPEPDRKKAPVAQAREAPVSPRVAAWQERKAEELATAAKAARQATEPAMLPNPTATPAAPAHAAVVEGQARDEADAARPSRKKQKAQRQAKRSRQPGATDLGVGYAASLGYAAVPPARFDSIYSAMRDRPSN